MHSYAVSRCELPVDLDNTARASGGAGAPVGRECAGFVTESAADGSGPGVGTRVAGLASSGSWAEFARLRTDRLAVIDDGVMFEEAAALSVSAQTAYRAWAKCGWLLGKQVLVTGAAGGVGVFAVQLAHVAGARVFALASTPHRRRVVQRLGAEEALNDLDKVGPRRFDAVLDTVGGPVLGAALHRIKDGGTIVSVGAASGAAAVIAAEALSEVSHFDLTPFDLEAEVGNHTDTSEVIATLASYVAEGLLRPMISDVLPWQYTAEALGRLADRQVLGKVVLQVE